MARRPADSTVLRYIRECARLLGLAHLDLELSDEPCGDDVWAHIRVHSQKSHALISLHPEFTRQPSADQRRYVAHELVHCHLAALDWSVADLVDGLGVRAKRVASATWEQRSERACDDLARLLAPGLPLPPWNTPTGR